MRYNKLGQGYNIVRHFNMQPHGGEKVFYTEVLFTDTKHKQIIYTEQMHTGEFEDLLLKVHNECTDENVDELNEIPVEIKALEKEEVEPPITEAKSFKTILADPPQGAPVEVSELYLDDFCYVNELDIESVKNVLAGISKTHKRWKFSYKASK